MKEQKKRSRRRIESMESMAVSPPKHLRLSATERAARATMASRAAAGREMLPTAVIGKRGASAPIVSLFGRPVDAERGTARERLRQAIVGWDTDCGVLSLDEMMALAAIGLSDEEPHNGMKEAKVHARSGEKFRRHRAKARAAETEDLMWSALSLEYALVWKFCDEDRDLRHAAAEIAQARTSPAATMRRALTLYIAMLGQNLRARGIVPDRVVRFAHTGMRPRQPILPAGVSMDDIESLRWVDQRPLSKLLRETRPTDAPNKRRSPADVKI